MYEIELNSDQVVIRKDGSVIAEDYQSQDYCDFLTWLARPLNAENRGSTFIIDQDYAQYFSTKEHLIEHCKRQGLNLWVNPTSAESCELKLTWGRRPAIDRINHPRCGFGEVYVAGPNCEKVGSGLIDHRANLWLEIHAIDDLNSSLQDITSDSSKASCWPATKSFVYLDVSDFSKFLPGQQLAVVNCLNRLIDSRCSQFLWANHAAHRAIRFLSGRICIGDGYIYIFDDPQEACVFACCMAYMIERLSARRELKIVPIQFHFRIGIHHGPVYRFWDPGRQDWNYIGEGINGGQRVLTAAGKDKDDVIFVSGELRNALMALSKRHDAVNYLLTSCMINKGRHVDKHGNPWRIYELNHEEVANNFYSGNELHVPD